MNKTIIILLLGVIAVLLLTRSCQPGTRYIIPHIDTKPIKASINKRTNEIIALNKLAANNQANRVRLVNKYIQAKADTVIRNIIIACDSIVADTALIHTQRIGIAVRDSLINDLRILNKADSTNSAITIDSLRIRLRDAQEDLQNQKCLKWGILALWGIRELSQFGR